MHYIIFGTIALIFLIVSYLIGVKKQLNLICTLDESNIGKLKNKSLTAYIFSIYYLFTGIASLLCPILINKYDEIGLLYSVVTLLVLFSISIIMSIILYNHLNKL